MHFSRWERLTPKALNHPAQRGGGGEWWKAGNGRVGCEERATLGNRFSNGPILKGLNQQTLLLSSI